MGNSSNMTFNPSEASAMDSSMSNTMMSLSVVNIVLHTLGFYILTTLYRQSKRKTSQQIYLIGHSAVITVKNITGM